MKDKRFLVLIFGLLIAFMVGATRIQSYVNGVVHKNSEQTSLHLFHLDRTYLRKFTTQLSKFWVNGKASPGKDGILLATEFNNIDD